MKLTKESWIIAAIGLADLITTIIFIREHGAQEANPLFRHYWEMGLAAFIAAKFVCLFGPLLVLEWARKRNPKFVLRALRGAIAAYLVMYGVGFMKLNSPQARAEELPHSSEIIAFRPEFKIAADIYRDYYNPQSFYLEPFFTPARRHIPRFLLLQPYTIHARNSINERYLVNISEAKRKAD